MLWVQYCIVLEYGTGFLALVVRTSRRELGRTVILLILWLGMAFTRQGLGENVNRIDKASGFPEVGIAGTVFNNSTNS